jgi:hypothetical protein
VRRARAMLKEVDCLPMVKPDAASHLGIRHVRVRAFQASSDVGSPHRRWVTFRFPQRGKGDLTWDVREWEMRGCHLRVQCSTRLDSASGLML